MNSDVERWVDRTSLVAGAVAVVLSPIPLADEVVMVPLLGALSWRIGVSHGLSARELPWAKLGAAAVAGLAARAVAGLAFALVPGVSAVTNALSAVALTRGFAVTAEGICAGAAHDEAPAVAAVA